MKLIRQIALTTMLTIGAFSAITYTSCNKDECKDVVCKNGGTCNSTDGSCSCATGFEGTDCGTLVRAKFLGMWGGTDNCTNPTSTFTVNLTVSASSNDVQALLNNPGGFGTAITITGTITGANVLSFTNQNVGSGTTLTGTMTLSSSNALTFAYTATDADGTQTCSGSYTKQ